MKKTLPLLISFILFYCTDSEENNSENQIRTDLIIGRWQEILDQASLYNTITWTFLANGEMQLDFDEEFIADGQWSKLPNSANGYSFTFQQYPDATQRTFFLELNFTSNNSAVNITDDSSTFHWVRNRVLNKLE